MSAGFSVHWRVPRLLFWTGSWEISLSSAGELAAQIGIRLRRDSPQQKVLCPQCSHLRKNKREPCLSVNINKDGIQYRCHNCGWHGGRFYDGHQPKDSKVVRGQEDRS